MFLQYCMTLFMQREKEFVSSLGTWKKENDHLWMHIKANVHIRQEVNKINCVIRSLYMFSCLSEKWTRKQIFLPVNYSIMNLNSIILFNHDFIIISLRYDIVFDRLSEIWIKVWKEIGKPYYQQDFAIHQFFASIGVCLSSANECALIMLGRVASKEGDLLCQIRPLLCRLPTKERRKEKLYTVTKYGSLFLYST